MKKEDFLAVLCFVMTMTGAALYYFGYILAGQIVYTSGMFAGNGMIKLKAFPLQGWLALISTAGIGYVVGDWWLSVAAALGFLAVNLRVFALRDKIYSTVNWQESTLGILGVGIYVTANLIHDNGWQGWVFPAIVIVFGISFSLIGFADRTKVRKLIQKGLIEVGSPAPDFSLESSEGKKVSLSDYKGVRELLLIFVRGDWCPSCHIMLRMYEKERKKFQDKNIMLFAIGPDPVGVNRAMVEKLGVEFAVLSDETLEVSKKFCLHIQEHASGSGMEAGVPLPASFLIDKQGIVRYTSRANNAGEFLRPDVIFDVLAKI